MTDHSLNGDKNWSHLQQHILARGNELDLYKKEKFPAFQDAFEIDPYILHLGMTRIPIAIGRAVHYIFSFLKKEKKKDVISIPHAILFSAQSLCIIRNFFI